MCVSVAVMDMADTHFCLVIARYQSCIFLVVFVWARVVCDDVFVVLSFLGPIMRNDVNENENGNFDFVVYDFLSLLSGVICWVMSCFVSYWSFLRLNCLYGYYWVRYRIFFKSDYGYFISF